MANLTLSLLLLRAVVVYERDASLRRTWDAIVQVESGGNPLAVGDKGRAVGVGQLHKVYVDEANRIIGKRKWSYADRLDPEQCWRMFRLVSLYHHAHGNPEVWARCHVAGPDGDRQACSLPYWRKVQKHLR